MRGIAGAGAYVTIYDGDEVIGTVVADAGGSWIFYFTQYKEIHTLSAIACEGQRCSERSRTVEVHRPDTSPPVVCRRGVTLSQYHYSIPAGQQLQIAGKLPSGSSGVVHLAWGDDSTDLFTVGPDGELAASHTFSEPGGYGGYIILSDGEQCRTATYFAVEVTDATDPFLKRAIVGALVASATIISTVTALHLLRKP